jgi:2-C-methyl-D-erythritol 4-phosphate cytidylyltransferase
VANALQAVETELVAIHDAARPLITPALIEALVADLDEHPEAAAVIAASAVTDTIKVAVRSRAAFPTQEGGNAALAVRSTLDRSVLWGAQTPQVFRTQALREALEVDEAARDAATDEAMLVEAAGGTVLLHPVSAPNLKVTTPDDLRIAELLLSERA